MLPDPLSHRESKVVASNGGLAVVRIVDIEGMSVVVQVVQKEAVVLAALLSVEIGIAVVGEYGVDVVGVVPEEIGSVEMDVVAVVGDAGVVDAAGVVVVVMEQQVVDRHRVVDGRKEAVVADGGMCRMDVGCHLAAGIVEAARGMEGIVDGVGARDTAVDGARVAVPRGGAAAVDGTVHRVLDQVGDRVGHIGVLEGVPVAVHGDCYVHLDGHLNVSTKHMDC